MNKKSLQILVNRIDMIFCHIILLIGHNIQREKNRERYSVVQFVSKMHSFSGSNIDITATTTSRSESES